MCDDSPDTPFELRVMSVADGTTRTVVPSFRGPLTWANNGRDLLFVRDDKELWRVGIDGADPQKVWQWDRTILDHRMHPDGRRLAFASGMETSELWLMENFLPEEVASAGK